MGGQSTITTFGGVNYCASAQAFHQRAHDTSLTSLLHIKTRTVPAYYSVVIFMQNVSRDI